MSRYRSVNPPRADADGLPTVCPLSIHPLRVSGANIRGTTIPLGNRELS